MRGIVYGVGVGPGDPELMTLKALRIIRENPVIAVPGDSIESSLAYHIASKAVPELKDKELLAVPMPMTRDRKVLNAAHRKGANAIRAYLDQGKNVVYLTLGDPTIYCSFTYLKRILEAEGCRVELVSGVPSFCAAAARLKLSLADGDEQIHILPGSDAVENAANFPGTVVLMKPGRTIPELRSALNDRGQSAWMVSNLGMDSEKTVQGLVNFPDKAEYLSVILLKQDENAT